MCDYLLRFGMLAPLFGTWLQAADYHVALHGSDAAAGGEAAPWRTINHAAGLAQAGDTVVIHAGTYHLARQIDFAHSGRSGNPITYCAAESENVQIDGGFSYCLGLQGCSYLVFQDLRFTTTSTAVGAGMVYFEGTNYCQFLGCTFSDMPAEVGSENTAAIRCMQTEVGQSVGCVFRNNLFTNCRSPAMRLYDTDGWIIENNEFVDCLHAVGGKDQPNNMLVRRNRITGGELAFYFPGQSGCTNVTITENIVIGTDSCFQVGGLGTYDRLRDDIKMFNNSFYNCGHLITGWTDEFTRRQAYHSNIFHDTVARNIGGGEDNAGRFLNVDKYSNALLSDEHHVMDWNCLSIPADDTSPRFVNARQGFNTIAEWTAARPTFEVHSIAANPLFVNAAGGNFHLQPGSPCRGAGRNGVDMGAYPRGDDNTIIGRLPAGADTVSPPRPAAPTVDDPSVFRPAFSGTTESGAVIRIFDAGVQIGTVTADDEGTWSWRPSSDLAMGSHVITIVAVDASGNASEPSPATVVTVEPPANRQPIANSQNLSVPRDQAESITLSGSDADGDDLAFAIVLGPNHGSLLGSGTAWTYAPTAGYIGDDSFTFMVNDGLQDSEPAMVSIQISTGSGSDSNTSAGDSPNGKCGAGGAIALLIACSWLLRLRSGFHSAVTQC